MAIEKKKEVREVNWFPNNHSVSIRLEEVIYEDGVELMRGKGGRRAFIPGEIEEVKKFIGIETGPEIDFLTNKWTDEVIAKHRASIG